MCWQTAAQSGLPVDQQSHLLARDHPVVQLPPHFSLHFSLSFSRLLTHPQVYWFFSHSIFKSSLFSISRLLLTCCCCPLLSPPSFPPSPLCNSPQSLQMASSLFCTYGPLSFSILSAPTADSPTTKTSISHRSSGFSRSSKAKSL